MLKLLAGGEHTVGELAAPFQVSLAASSKHLQVLCRAGLVEQRVVGRTHACRLVASPLKLVVDWTDAFRAHWELSFARLDAVLEELAAAAPRPKRSPRRPRGTTARRDGQRPATQPTRNTHQ